MSYPFAERPLLAFLTDHVCTTVVGRHRARFLNAMTTADFMKAKPGDAGFALMATSNGRHVGQVRYEVEADAVVLVGRATSVAAVLEGLKKHKVADDVRWSEPAAEAVLALYGERAAALVEGFFATTFEHAYRDLTWNDTKVRITRIDAVESELGRPLVHVRVPLAVAPSLRVRLLAAGAEPLDQDDWERQRIEAGWPLDGLDLGSEDVALASERLAATVSWTKGCFLGQEVYVMARDRGELPKRLRGVMVPTGGAPTIHSELLQPEATKVQGLVGSAAPVAGGGYLAMAMLKRKASEPGTELALADGRRVQVIALPRG